MAKVSLEPVDRWITSSKSGRTNGREFVDSRTDKSLPAN
jgi:hypothetical protein